MTKYKFEYMWLDGYRPIANLRSKTKIIEMEPGVQDAAVATAGVLAAVVFFIDQDHLRPVKTFAEFAGNTQPHNTAADYQKVRFEDHKFLKRMILSNVRLQKAYRRGADLNKIPSLLPEYGDGHDTMPGEFRSSLYPLLVRRGVVLSS